MRHPAPDAPPLKPEEVHLWLADPDAVDDAALEGLRALLSEDEVAKAARYRRACDARQSVVARGMLRRALSTYRPEVAPEAWCFVAGAQGKPALADGQLARPLCFNVTHTFGCVAVAVAEGDRELGVDAEDISRSSDIARIANRFFAPREVAQLEGLEGDGYCERFFAFWTLKEAYIKARGLGLALPLKGFWFDLQAARPRIAFGPEIEDRPERWRFWQHAPNARHRLAVALDGAGELRVRVLEVFGGPAG